MGGVPYCISPMKGRSPRTYTENRVWVHPETIDVIQDSAAFQDTGNDQRLDFGAALARQQYHAEKYKYADKRSYIATYDWLIDEMYLDGARVKKRWSENAAATAVSETINAAHYYNRNRVGVPLVISAQGVTPSQYFKCVKRLMPAFRSGDMLGLGGWCVIGLYPSQLMPSFRETVKQVIPFAAKEGIKRVHIWGVMFAPALGYLLAYADMCGVQVSTDSSGMQTKPAIYGEYGYAEWRVQGYIKKPSRERGAERVRHVQDSLAWLDSFRSTQWYSFDERNSTKQRLGM